MIAQLVQVIITLILPAFLLYAFYVTKFPTKPIRHLTIALYALVLIVIFMIARWDALFYPLRYIFPIAFLIIAVLVWRRPLAPTDKTTKSSYIGVIAGIVVFLPAVVYLLISSTPPSNAIDIASPIKEGPNLVVHGGDATPINYHNYHKKQRYALDIIGFDLFNNPFSDKKNLENYSIFGKTIISPCTGKVKEAKNDAPDLTPPEKDKENPSGNEVVIECKGVLIQLSHMAEGSVLVKAGDNVTEGQELGKIGNTGNTSEPHLHIHATKDDVAVPLTINGSFPVRNNILP